MTSARQRKKMRKDSSAIVETRIAVQMKENIDDMMLDELGVEHAADTFDPRGKLGQMEPRTFADNFVTVHFVQEVEGRPIPRTFEFDMPRHFVTPLEPTFPTPL